MLVNDVAVTKLLYYDAQSDPLNSVLAYDMGL